jgi:hypothetical protein
MKFKNTTIKTHLQKSIHIQKILANRGFTLNLKLYQKILRGYKLNNLYSSSIDQILEIKTLLEILEHDIQNNYHGPTSEKNIYLENSKYLISKCIERRSENDISVIANNFIHFSKFEEISQKLLSERDYLKNSDPSYTLSRKNLLELFDEFDLKKNEQLLEELKMVRKEIKKTIYFYHFLFFVFTNKDYTKNYLDELKIPFRMRYRRLPKWFTEQFLKNIDLDSNLGIPANNYLIQNYNIGYSKKRKNKNKELGCLKWNTNNQFKILENTLDQFQLAGTMVERLKDDEQHCIFLENFKSMFEIDLEHWQQKGISKNDKNNMILQIEKIKSKEKRYLTGHQELMLVNIERQLYFLDKILIDFLFNSLLFQKVIQKSTLIPEEIRRKEPNKKKKLKQKRKKKIKKRIFSKL